MIILATVSASTWAHHSTAMFDYSKSMTLEGTVKEFKWTNPHMFVRLIVPDAQGQEVEWNIECGTPNTNVRHGWKQTDLKPGDKVKVEFHPTRDLAALSGTLMTVTLPDSRTLYAPANDVVGTP